MNTSKENKKGGPMSVGVDLIAKERKRQIKKEGWSPKHDSQHTGGELVMAAISYAAASGDEKVYTAQKLQGEILLNDTWPWDPVWDKRKKHSEKKCLIVAGALIAAELDRVNAEEAGTFDDDEEEEE